MNTAVAANHLVDEIEAQAVDARDSVRSRFEMVVATVASLNKQIQQALREHDMRCAQLRMLNAGEDRIPELLGIPSPDQLEIFTSLQEK